jgi:hypothetical protein
MGHLKSRGISKVSPEFSSGEKTNPEGGTVYKTTVSDCLNVLMS